MCEQDALVGIIHLPSKPGPLGVLVLIGGPQYRVGSHRQFVLLSRTLAQAGFPVFRFDHRGIGDSGGAPRSFQELDDDIECAIDAFLDSCPDLKQIYILGLCDAATAASMYAEKDPRVSGLVLLNPWVRPDSGYSKSFLMSYYMERLLNYRFWRNYFEGNKSIRHSVKSAAKSLFPNTSTQNINKSTEDSRTSDQQPRTSRRSSRPRYQARMLTALQAFHGRTLIILSGNDLTAAEFKQLTDSDRRWKRLLKSSLISCFEMPSANHTFSTRIWRDIVAERTVKWLRSV